MKTRYVQNVHQDDDQVYVGNDKEVIEAPEKAMERTSQESATFQMLSWANEEVLNASFTSETAENFRWLYVNSWKRNSYFRSFGEF